MNRNPMRREGPRTIITEEYEVASEKLHYLVVIAGTEGIGRDENILFQGEKESCTVFRFRFKPDTPPLATDNSFTIAEPIVINFGTGCEIVFAELTEHF